MLETAFDQFFVNDIALVRMRELARKMRMKAMKIMDYLMCYGDFDDFFRDAWILKKSVDGYLRPFLGCLDMAEFIFPLSFPENEDVLFLNIRKEKLPDLIETKF